MANITITCDRCGKLVHGTIDEANGVPTITGGYYDVTSGSWGEFARWEEERVCDACMHADPKYFRRYNIGNE